MRWLDPRVADRTAGDRRIAAEADTPTAVVDRTAAVRMAADIRTAADIPVEAIRAAATVTTKRICAYSR